MQSIDFLQNLFLDVFGRMEGSVMAAGAGKARTIIRAFPLVVLDVVATAIAYISAAWGTGVFGQILGLGDFSQVVVVIALINVAVFVFGHMYNVLWEYASVDEMVRIVCVVTVASIVSDVTSALIFGQRPPWSVYGVAWIILLCVVGASRFAIRLYSGSKCWSLMGVSEKSGKSRTLIDGEGETGSLPCDILNTGQGNQLNLPGLFASSAQNMQTQFNRFSQFSYLMTVNSTNLAVSTFLLVAKMRSDLQKLAGAVSTPVSDARELNISKAVG